MFCTEGFSKVRFVRQILVSLCLLFIFFVLGASSIFAVSREDLGEIYFFTGTENLSGEWDYSKSPKVALAPSESSYGYILSLPTNDPAMITDILTLPKSPENWGLTPIKEGDFGYIGKTISFSKDLRTMFIKEKVFPNKDKRHVNQLEVAKGDPPGRYSWTVLVDGQYLDTGNFQLVLTGGALASIPTEKDVAQLMQKLKQIKGEARGLSSACLETDWGQPEEYSNISKREAYLKADQFIARHQNAISLWENCKGKSVTKMLGGLSILDKLDLFVSNLSPPNKRWSSAVILLRKDFNEEKKAYGQIYDQLVDLEKDFIAYFIRLKRLGFSGTENLTLTFPDSVEKKEAQIYETFMKQYEISLNNMEAMYTLYPTVALGARKDNMKVLIAVMKAGRLGYSNINDENIVPHLKESLKEIQVARFLTYQSLNNEDLLALEPQVKEHYEIISKGLKEWEDHLNSFIKIHQIELDNISEDDALKLLLAYFQISGEFEKIGESLEHEFEALELLLVND